MNIQRRFMPGDEWLYYKVYAGTGIQEKLLVNEIYMVAARLYNSHAIDRFFFIRYSDQEGPHLRLRFRLTDSGHLSEVMLLMQTTLKTYLANRIVAKIAIDTYQRELERYGAGNIEHIETLFSVNSWAVLSVHRHHFMQEEAYWLAGIKLVDDLLDDLGLELEEKYAIYKQLYDVSWKNQPVNTVTNAALSMKYRHNTPAINKRMALPLNYDRAIPWVGREAQQQALAAIVANTASDGPSLVKIVSSVIHMCYNRMFPTSQNAIEMVIYYMMHKFYKSRAAQEVAKNKL
jgi:thiopeptide-type bacteriocin biosynthesis protein